MPTVPQSRGPQVREQALQGGFQQAPSSPAPFGALAAQQTGQLGNALVDTSNVLDKHVERLEIDDAMRVETTVKDEWRKFSGELRKRRGRDAEGVLADSEKWWNEAAERHGKDLSPRGKALIGKSLGNARVGELGRMQGYQEQELDRSFIESTTADIGVEIDRYATNADPKGAAAAREVITRNVDLLAGRLGWEAGRREQELKKYTNIMHRQMIDTLLDVSPTGAKEYLAANRDEIAGSALATVERQVAKAFSDEEGQRLAASFANLPFDQQLAKAAEIKDPDVSKAARTYVRQNQQDIQVATAAREKQVSDQVWQLVGQGTPQGRLPKALLDQLDGKERVQVNEHYEAARRRAVAEAKGSGVKTDWALYAQLREMPAEEFKNLKLSTYVDKIAGPQMEQLLDLRTRVNKPDEAAQAATQQQQMSAYVGPGGLGLNDTKKGQFQNAYYTEEAEFIKQHKRKPTFEERQKMMDGLTKEVVTEGWLWNSKQPAYAVPRDQRDGVPDTPAAQAPATPPAPPRLNRIVNVPMADRNEITTVLRARGQPVTEDNIQRLYQAANK